MSNEFRQWVSTELDKRNWSHRELARQIGDVSRALVSRVLSGDMPASCEFCIKVAAALDTPPETVLRLAGHLPPGAPALPADSPTLQQLVELARTLPPEKQEEVLRYVRFLLS